MVFFPRFYLRSKAGSEVGLIILNQSISKERNIINIGGSRIECVGACIGEQRIVSHEAHAVGCTSASVKFALLEALAAGRLASWGSNVRPLLDVVRSALVHVVLPAEEILLLEVVACLGVLAAGAELIDLLVDLSEFDKTHRGFTFAILELTERCAFSHGHLVALKTTRFPVRGGSCCWLGCLSRGHLGHSEISLPSELSSSR